jgi:hypothetical protein
VLLLITNTGLAVIVDAITWLALLPVVVLARWVHVALFNKFVQMCVQVRRSHKTTHILQVTSTHDVVKQVGCAGCCCDEQLVVRAELSCCMTEAPSCIVVQSAVAPPDGHST